MSKTLKMGSGLLNLIYPVGSIYISVNSTSPHDLFGGTWEQIKDRFLLACGSTYANGATGGEAFHTLTVDEMPNHRHGLDYYINYNLDGGYDKLLAYGSTTAEVHNTDYFMNFTGGGEAHNNMPPYLAVYIWERIA